jgi:DnaJ-domain-containing protein 1
MKKKTKITLTDRSIYFKGLLLLVCNDGEVHEKERAMMLRVGKMLDFEQRFCEKTIAKALGNSLINAELPKFSNTDVAKCFIRDGVRMSLADGHFHAKENDFLKRVAIHHGLEEVWFEQAVKSITDQMASSLISGLDAENLDY